MDGEEVALREIDALNFLLFDVGEGNDALPPVQECVDWSPFLLCLNAYKNDKKTSSHGHSGLLRVLASETCNDNDDKLIDNLNFLKEVWALGPNKWHVGEVKNGWLDL